MLLQPLRAGCNLFTCRRQIESNASAFDRLLAAPLVKQSFAQPTVKAGKVMLGYAVARKITATGLDKASPEVSGTTCNRLFTNLTKIVHVAGTRENAVGRSHRQWLVGSLCRAISLTFTNSKT
jgi:hypothetical protein